MEPSDSEFNRVRRWAVVAGMAVASFGLITAVTAGPGVPLPLYGPLILADAPSDYPVDQAGFGIQGRLTLTQGCLLITNESDAVAVWPTTSTWDADEQAASTRDGNYSVGSRVVLQGSLHPSAWRTAFRPETVDLIELCQEVTGATEVAVVS